MTCAPSEYDEHVSRFPHMAAVPQPPTLPRILDKVILNSEPRRTWDDPSNVNPLDDNSILPVPNHVVLNHLTASAIKNGTLGVGTTTRYRKKVITTRLAFTNVPVHHHHVFQTYTGRPDGWTFSCCPSADPRYARDVRVGCQGSFGVERNDSKCSM